MMASVRLYGRHVGELWSDRNGDLSFRYAPQWIEESGSGKVFQHPLSVSLPPRPEVYGQSEAGPFFYGLLPDNPIARRALATNLKIEAPDDYNLLLKLGRECAGAVAIMPGGSPIEVEGSATPGFKVEDDKSLARHIRNLPIRPLFLDADGEVRMSLAGFQNKAAVLLTSEGIALPKGGAATTHVLKSDIAGLPDSTRVENFCLKIASAVGIKTVSSSIRVAEGQPYLLVARYDRSLAGPDGAKFVRRLHQEDFAQALGRFPCEKFEKDGGPGWKDCFDLMNRTADPLMYRSQLLSRAVFQFLIGNPDAHAKNYSLVYRRDGLHLSHLYDINNASAFRGQYKAQKARLAMFVDGECDPSLLTKEHWDGFADEVGVRRETVAERLFDLAAKIPQAVLGIRSNLAGSEADTPLLDIAAQDILSKCALVMDWKTDLTPKPFARVPTSKAT